LIADAVASAFFVDAIAGCFFATPFVSLGCIEYFYRLEIVL